MAMFSLEYDLSWATCTAVHVNVFIDSYCVSSRVAVLEKVQAVLSATSVGISFLSS